MGIATGRGRVFQCSIFKYDSEKVGRQRSHLSVRTVNRAQLTIIFVDLHSSDYVTTVGVLKRAPGIFQKYRPKRTKGEHAPG